MPIGTVSEGTWSHDFVTDLVTSFKKLKGHPFDNIRKRWYRENALGWYMDPDAFAQWYSYRGGDKAARQYVRNVLLEHGIPTCDFSISTTLRAPDGRRTVYVFKIDYSLANL